MSFSVEFGNELFNSAEQRYAGYVREYGGQNQLPRAQQLKDHVLSQPNAG